MALDEPLPVTDVLPADSASNVGYYKNRQIDLIEAGCTKKQANAIITQEVNMKTRKLASGRMALLADDGKVVRILPHGGHTDDPPTTPKKPAPEPCYQCNGSGLFFMGGGTVNGKFTGKTGKCYRCGGKGVISAADEKRNEYYDNNIRKIHL